MTPKTTAKLPPTIVGENLRRIRKARGLTIQELGQKAGVHWVTISKIETGQTRDPGHETMLSLAEALDTTESELTKPALDSFPIAPLIAAFLASDYGKDAKPTTAELDLLRGFAANYFASYEVTPKMLGRFLELMREGRTKPIS